MLTWRARSGLVLTGSALLGLLLVAFALSPDPRGLGTHQQLGLPPCSVRMLFGIRCPACGMTTSWSHLTRGNAVEAVQANAGGALLALLALLAGSWAVASGVLGRPLFGAPSMELTLVACLVVVLVTGVDYLVRLLFTDGT